MIDDMDGLFSHASDVYRAGQKSGRDELHRAALAALGHLSSKFEKSGDISAFRAAEDACGILRNVSKELDKPKTV